MTGLLTQANGVAPSTPSAGFTSTYPDANGVLHTINANGVDVQLGDHGAAINYIRNGEFFFAQRQIPGTATTRTSVADRAFTADGWGISNETGSTTYQRIDTATTPETGIVARYYGTHLKITATGKLAVSQALEGIDACRLRGRRVRVRGCVKATASTTLRLGLIYLTAAGTIDTIPGLVPGAWNGTGVDPTWGTNLTALAPVAGITPENATTTGLGVDIAATTSWMTVSACFDVPATSKNLLVVLWSNAQLTATSGWSNTQMMLTDGPEIRDWWSPNPAAELQRCERFYQKTFEPDQNPVTNVGVTSGCLRGILGKAGATALAAQIRWMFRTAMRTAPSTVTTYNPAAGNAQVRQIGGTAADLTATATANATANGVDVTATGAGAGAVGDQFGVHVSADADL